MNTLRGYLKIREAAALLGVAPNTLRAWARAGKVRMHRNPLNNYRLFMRADLEKLLRQIKNSAVKPALSESRRPR